MYVSAGKDAMTAHAETQGEVWLVVKINQVKRVNYWCLASLKTDLWTQYLVIDSPRHGSDIRVTCWFVLYGRRRRSFPSSTDTPHACKCTAPERWPAKQHTSQKKRPMLTGSGYWNRLVFTLRFCDIHRSFHEFNFSYVHHVLPAAGFAV